jgi:hypothetical protein
MIFGTYHGLLCFSCIFLLFFNGQLPYLEMALFWIGCSWQLNFRREKKTKLSKQCLI